MHVATLDPQEERLIAELRRLVIAHHGRLRGYMAAEVKAAITAHVADLERRLPRGGAQ